MELKFRAWNTDSKNMVDLKSITPLALDFKLNIDGVFLPFTGTVIIMQFSGWQDKNSKDIYEGDIIDLVNADNEKIRGVCKCGMATRKIKGYKKLNECEISGFYFLNKEGAKTFPIVRNYLKKHDTEIFEVVGNIYENPELLIP